MGTPSPENAHISQWETLSDDSLTASLLPSLVCGVGKFTTGVNFAAQVRRIGRSIPHAHIAK
jgi:hypothetical protein